MGDGFHSCKTKQRLRSVSISRQTPQISNVCITLPIFISGIPWPRLKKSPEERTHWRQKSFTTFSRVSRKQTKISDRNRWQGSCRDRRSAKAGGYSAVRAYKLTFRWNRSGIRPREKWFLSYGVLDAIFKFTDNPVYKRMNSRSTRMPSVGGLHWTGYFELQKKYREDPLHNDKPKIPDISKYGKHCMVLLPRRQTAGGGRKVLAQACKPEGTGMHWKHFPVWGDEVCKDGDQAGIWIHRIPGHLDDRVKEKEPPESPKRIPGLDPRYGEFPGRGKQFRGVPFVIRGGAIKSANQRFNKKRAALISSHQREGQYEVR